MCLTHLVLFIPDYIQEGRRSSSRGQIRQGSASKPNDASGAAGGGAPRGEGKEDRAQVARQRSSGEEGGSRRRSAAGDSRERTSRPAAAGGESRRRESGQADDKDGGEDARRARGTR